MGTINRFFCIGALLIVTMNLLVGCGNTVPKAQKGGSAQFASSPASFQIEQPENSQAQTTSTYEREIIPYNWTNLITGTNWAMMRERFSTTLGEHQTDEARGAWGTVAKCATVLKSMSPIMYAGIALIFIALAMSYFQAKFPAVFTPGLKLIALTFFTGLFMTILPSLTQNTTILTVTLVAGIAAIVAFTLAKKFTDSKTSTSTTTTTLNAGNETGETK
jgi:hypothetical protein